MASTAEGLREMVADLGRRLCLAEEQAALALLSWYGRRRPEDYTWFRNAIRARVLADVQLRRNLRMLGKAAGQYDATRAESEVRDRARRAYLRAMGLPARETGVAS